MKISFVFALIIFFCINLNAKPIFQNNYFSFEPLSFEAKLVEPTEIQKAFNPNTKAAEIIFSFSIANLTKQEIKLIQHSLAFTDLLGEVILQIDEETMIKDVYLRPREIKEFNIKKIVASFQLPIHRLETIKFEDLRYNYLATSLVMGGNKVIKLSYGDTDQYNQDPEQTKLTTFEIQALMNQMKKCFSTPAGVYIEKGIFFKVQARYDENGKVKKNTIRVIDTNWNKNQKDYYLMEESVINTFLNPDCEYPMLSMKKYDAWKIITYTLDYSSMTK